MWNLIWLLKSNFQKMENNAHTDMKMTCVEDFTYSWINENTRHMLKLVQKKVLGKSTRMWSKGMLKMQTKAKPAFFPQDRGKGQFVYLSFPYNLLNCKTAPRHWKTKIRQPEAWPPHKHMFPWKHKIVSIRLFLSIL